ncbi:MAG: heliorhodopsin HeR [Acidimicrobiales bacterium]
MTMAAHSVSRVEGADPIDVLRKVNLALALAHGLQAGLMIALSNDLSLPVTALFGTGPPGQPLTPPQVEQLFSYRLGWGVALFSALSALFHLLVASGWGFPRYRNELLAGRNRFRWVEYSISASVMIVLIAGLTGLTDVVALLGLFAINAAMILFGWLMETTNPLRPAGDWTPFVFGCIVGAVPWIGILIYLVGAGSDVPGFVYGIFVSLFVLFNCFAINQVLQYRARGRWARYLFGERVYLILSLVAKSLLAWQIFANVLVG